MEADDEVRDVSQHKIERWERDLELLIQEHDNQTWLTCLWFKLIDFNSLRLAVP
jgi:hypothetical protein